MRSSRGSVASLLLAFVLLLVVHGYHGIQARPLKYDALQRSASRVARLYVPNTTRNNTAGGDPTESVSVHLQSDEELLDQVAYRNPERWLVSFEKGLTHVSPFPLYNPSILLFCLLSLSSSLIYDKLLDCD